METTGYRFQPKWDGTPSIGQELAPSFQWDENCEPTDQELDGTCAFRSIESVHEYAKHSKGQGWILKITGNDEGAGPDLADEILISSAIVSEITEW